MIKKNWRYWCLGLLLVIGEWQQLNQGNHLFKDPDSYGYFEVAQQIINLKVPDFSFRTPTFPLLIVPMMLINRLEWTKYLWCLGGVLGGLATLWILDGLSTHKKINMMITLFLWLDYGISNFRGELLTESVAPVFIVLMIALNLKWWKSDGKIWKWVVVMDILTAFLKSTFLFLPLVLKVYFLVINKWFDNGKKKKEKLWWGLVWTLVIVLFLPTYNYLTKGNFIISEIGRDNVLGVILKNGYLDNDVGNPPWEVAEVVDIYKNNEINNVWQFMKIIKNNLGSNRKIISEVNSYFIERNWSDYLVSVWRNIPIVATENRTFYINVNQELKGSFWTGLEDKYNQLNLNKWNGWLMGCLIWSLFLIKKDKNKLVYLGSILLVSGVVLVEVSAFGFVEYFRLRQPIDIILGFLVIYPFLLIKIE